MKPRWLDSVAVALTWRYATHSAMVAMALWNEARPAPSLPDTLLDWIPRSDWVARHNYVIWLFGYVPVALLLLWRQRAAGLHFLYLGGWLSLLRGICIPLTGLGPVDGVDGNAGADAATLWHWWVGIVNPVSALTSNVAQVALTKDLFFSGHVSSTFLLWLYCRRMGVLGPVALAAHLVVTASVFLAHLHYTIDVVGAYAITYGLFVLVMRRWPVPGFA